MYPYVLNEIFSRPGTMIPAYQVYYCCCCRCTGTKYDYSYIPSSTLLPDARITLLTAFDFVSPSTHFLHPDPPRTWVYYLAYGNHWRTGLHCYCSLLVQTSLLVFVPPSTPPAVNLTTPHPAKYGGVFSPHFACEVPGIL